jgi:lysylphosphatidylglycerol synthetase-like protein (DUF2156 family)
MPIDIASPESVLDSLQRYGDNPSGFLAVNSGNSYFTVPGLEGVIAYRASGRYLVQFAGPFASAGSYAPLLRRFAEFARREGKEIVAIELLRKDAEVYAENGFTVNQVGASYSIDLSRFSLNGTAFMQLRNKVSRATRNGLTVAEVDAGEWAEAICGVDRTWLAGKGKDARALEFLVGEHGGPMQKYRRIFAGSIDREVVGYISYSPAYGSRPGWMHDLSRRKPGGSPGIMEAINVAAIERFRSESVRWLHFGFTPFASLAPEHELPGASKAYAYFMNWLWENGDFIYPAKSQFAYKNKWAPHDVQPEYIAFHGSVQAAGLIHVFKASNAF